MLKRSYIMVLAAATLLAGMAAAQAGPCTERIAQVQQQIANLQASSPPGGVGEPTAPQSLGAQLHRQPTPNSVQSAEQKANADGEAALDRARKADDAGDAAGCTAALQEAMELYGLQ